MTIRWLPPPLGTALLLCLLTSCNTTPSPPTTMVTVYADDPTYQALEETEAPWYGTLQRVERETSGQDAITYAVAYGQEKQRIRTKGTNAPLEGFVGKEVVVRGKLVASSGELVLWPALLKQNAAKLIDCLYEGQVPAPDDKLSPYLAGLLTERPGGQIERVAVSFCDDIEVTPESTPEELGKLREPLYAMLEEELEPYNVRILETSWLTQDVIAEMPLGKVRDLAGRADVMYLASVEEVIYPP